MASHGKSPGLLMRNAGIFNPVLVQAVGLCPVVAMATSVRSASLLAAVSAVIITLSELIASLFLKKVPRWVRIGIYIILGGAIVAPLMILIERTNAPLFGALGIYLPIMAVNSLNVLRCERFAVKISPLAALLDGITASVGYAAVLIVVGLIREVLGSGSIFGFRFFEGRTMTGLLLPFGGFIMLGFSGAILRVLISKFWPKYLDKKQPKPGFKKKHNAEKKQTVTPAAAQAPDFSADEPAFSLEDISAYDDEQVTVAETNELMAEEVTQKAPAAETEVQPGTNTVHDSPQEDEKEKEPAPIKETPAEEEPAAQEEHHEYKELSIEDLDSVTVTAASGDDELEKLMSRSIGDILHTNEAPTQDGSDEGSENKEDDEE